MSKAVIYCRVSSEKQVREGHGLAGQEKRCRDYATFHKYDVVAVFKDEGVSGGIIERPGIQALFRHVQKGNFTVIVDDLNRFARDVVAHFTLKKAIQDLNCNLVCVNMKLDDTPESKFIETMMAASGELERNRNRLQVCNRMKARMELGYWVFDAPPGYKYEKTQEHGKILSIDDSKADVIREALEGFANGRFLTQTDVQKFLNEKKFCHKGNYKTVYPEQVKRLLTRPLYAGLIHYPKWDIEERLGKHPPLISVETYHKIQVRLGLRANKQFTRKCDNEDFPVRGFVLCSECDKPLTASWSKGRNDRYAYYRCNTRGCNQKPKSIKKEIVEGEFVNALRAAKPDDAILNLTKQMTLDLYNQKMNKVGLHEQEVQAKINQIDLQIRVVTDKLIQTTSPAVLSALEQKIEALESEKACYQVELKQIDESGVDFGTAVERVMGFIESPDKFWVNGDLTQKKLVQRLVFTRPVTIHPHEGIGTADISLPFRMLRKISEDNSQLVGRRELIFPYTLLIFNKIMKQPFS